MRSCGQILSHRVSLKLGNNKPLTLLKHETFRDVQCSGSNYPRMGSTTEKWPAVRVRDTFIDFFKKNGHTFGNANRLRHIDTGTNIAYSTLILCRTAFRSHSPIRQCWNEPVQIHIPRYRRPFFRLCAAQACGEFPEGQQRLCVEGQRTDRDSAYVRAANIM